MWRNRSGLAVVFALVMVAACSSSGDTTGEPSTTSDASGDGGSTGSSVVIGSAGGTVEISAGSELAPGARLVVPPTALDRDLTVALEARTAPSDVFEPDATTLTALLDYSFTSDASAAIHPTMGPIAIVAAATPVGPEFVLSPDGAEFGAPVSLEIPVGAVPVPDGATLLALLESAGGQVEVIENIEVGDTHVVVPLSHFSAVKIISIPANVLDVFVFGTDEAAIDDAFDLVGPHVEQVSGAVVTSLCDRRDTVTFDPAGLPGYLGLLDNLARAEGDYIGGIDFDQLYEMGLWMNRIGDEGLPPVSVAEIYDQALTVTGGDAFGALVLAHETLRDDRFTKKYTQYVTDVRGDGPDARGVSTDEVGARYHLLGTAVYGFWYAYQQDHPDAFWSAVGAASGAPPIPTAEEAAAFEEAYVSGDISTDPGEFVVDLQGAQLGREAQRGRSRHQRHRCNRPLPQPTRTSFNDNHRNRTHDHHRCDGPVATGGDEHQSARRAVRLRGRRHPELLRVPALSTAPSRRTP